MKKKILRLVAMLPLLAGLLQLAGCSGQKEPDARQLVTQAIQAHGGEKYDNSMIAFRLAGKQYRALRDSAAFVYSRTFADTAGQRVYDVLRNSGFSRSIDDQLVPLPRSERVADSSSLAADVSFALLPYALHNAAARQEYAGEATVKGELYDKVRVTIAGHEYLYWLHQQRHTLDYVAYTMNEEGQAPGTSFRVAVNPRNINGIRFQDYESYTSREPLPLENYARAYEAGKLEKASDIVLEHVMVGEVK